jgi:hypothetical protein
MFQDVAGRLLSGVIWGAGAGIALSVLKGDGSGLRPIAKTLVKTSLSAADLFRSASAGARDQLNDLRAEVQAERTAEAASPKPKKQPGAQSKRAQGQ